MKFIVTGGCGFIGSHIARFLVGKNHDVEIIDNLERGSLKNILDIKNKIKIHDIDISNLKNLESVIDSPNGIFHQAALASVPTSFKEPEKYYKVNVIGTENIFKIGRKHNAKIIFASSSSIYGDQTKLPIKEDAEKHPKNPYGQTKLDSEIIASKYAKEEFIGIIINETKNTITIQTSRGKKKLLKLNSIININNQKILGKDIIKRPEDRIKK